MSTSSPRPDLSEQTRFWTQLVQQNPQPFALPTDNARPPAPAFITQTSSLPLPTGQWAKVREVSRRLSADPFSVVLAAFAMVVAKRTARQHVWLGTVAGDGGGSSANLLALGIRTLPSASREETVRATQAAIVAAARHRDLPFQRVAALFGTEPPLRLLVMPAGLKSAAWETTAAPAGDALGADAMDCDVTLTVTVPDGAVATLVATYDSELFQAATITGLLEAVAAELTALTASTPQVTADQRHAPDFSLLYFASDEGDYAHLHGRDKYRLLLEGARFADEHGFTAVWTPERHFHTFGGLFPSPSAMSAALAMTTSRVAIRAGSVVLPLHNPIRVAEEWSLIDNLSNGRVGVAFAAGWQPQDFAIAPDIFKDRHNQMFDSIAMVQGLWRGEVFERPGGDGNPVTVRSRPRPVQSELPTWVTAAGSPETFRRAGEAGANLLTHLLLQTIDQLASRIAIYRQAWQDAGHPGESGVVTLMLHTFVGDDDEQVRKTVHQPFKNYLKGAVGLFSALAPKGLDLATATPEELDSLAEHGFDRYFHTSGLFGTPESCLPKVEALSRIGVTELACLIDFGVPDDVVLASLPRLAELSRRARGEGVAATMPEVVDAVTSAPSAAPVAVLEAHLPSADVVDFVAPESATERTLANLWQDSLGVGEVGALDSFFDSGGHSLLAMQLARRIREQFAVDFSLEDFFAHPQLRELASYIDHLKVGPAATADGEQQASGFEYGEL